MGDVGLTERRRGLIFANLVLACVASSLLATALNTALPPIIGELGVSASLGQWLISAYSLAMAVMMPLTAFLITRFPTKRLFTLALAAFIAGLGICALSTSFPMMMAGRIVQACGNGVLNNLTQVVILSIYPLEKRGQAMGWYGLAVGAAPVIAPSLGGILVDTVGWRSIFWISIAVCSAALLMSLKVFGNVLDTRRQHFDLPSFVLSALAFGGLTLGVGNLANCGFASPATWAPLALGLAAGAVFALRQLRSDDPFLKLSILARRNFCTSVLGSMLLYFVMMGSSIIMPLYVQSILGRSALVSALVMLPGSLLMALISPYAGKILDKLGMRWLAILGSIALLLGNVGMSLVGMNTPLVVACLLNAVRCCAIGCIMMPIVAWGNNSIETRDVPHGTALLTSFRTIAGAMGTAVFVGIMEAAGAWAASPIFGMNVAFACMAAGSAVMLAGSVLLVRK